ncbi:MAG: hypothetical protein WCJ37_01145 [Syntrophus sp. (in: bacteria)]
MGFTSMDDLLAKISAGQIGRIDYGKTTTPAQVAGYWSNVGRWDGMPIMSAYAGASKTFVPTDNTSDGAPYTGESVGGSPIKTKHIINASANLFAAAGAPWILMCCDQIGYVPLAEADIESTTERTITMTALDSTCRYPAGVGLRAFFSTYTAPLTGGPNMTSFKYKNVAGDSHEVTKTINMCATPVAGQVPHSGNAANRFAPFIPLLAGDTGISDIEAFTWTGGTTYTGAGAMILHLVKPIFTLPLPANGIMTERDFVNQLPSLPRIVDGAHLMFMLFQTGATTTTSPLYITMDYAWE